MKKHSFRPSESDYVKKERLKEEMLKVMDQILIQKQNKRRKVNVVLMKSFTDRKIDYQTKNRLVETQLTKIIKYFNKDKAYFNKKN